jgi:putative transposase
VLLKIVCLLACRVPDLAVLVFRVDRAKDAGLLVLRHENAVLRRHTGRIRYEPGDRGLVRRAGTAPASQGAGPASSP